MYVELILGCMMSGKSTEMLRRMHRRLCLAAHKILYVRPSTDNRHDITHDKKTIMVETCVVTHLMEIVEKAREYDAVFIDEVQFFEDARAFLIHVEERPARLSYLAFSGLSGDSERKPWPVITELIPLVDNMTFKKALCVKCGDGQEASFSKCRVEKGDKILIGDSKMYTPVCRKHFKDDI